MSSRRAFTLIELLVVIGIIVLLVAISMPMVGRAWEMANETRCKSNLKNLTNAFLAFAKDNDNRLPGSLNAYGTDRNPDHWDWLFGAYSLWDSLSGKTIIDRVQTAPQYGTIWKYVNSYQTYLCPSLRFDRVGSGVGSNGRFDYAAFSCFGGAAITDISPVSELHFPMDPRNPNLVHDTNPLGSTNGFSSHFEVRPTPIICQEDAQYCINSNLEGQHCNLDQMSHIHNGGSWYGGIDGGVYFVNEPDTDASNVSYMGTNLWWQPGPSSKQLVALDGDGGWGWWSHR